MLELVRDHDAEQSRVEVDAEDGGLSVRWPQVCGRQRFLLMAS